MSTLIRNLLAIPMGLVAGSAINMTLVVLSPLVIAPPAGVAVGDAQSLAASMHLFAPRHFVMPFLAHALGTLAGALATTLFAASHKAPMAYAVGAIFLGGGVAMSMMIPAPGWFVAIDLLTAYVPMAWAGIWIGRHMQG